MAERDHRHVQVVRTDSKLCLKPSWKSVGIDVNDVGALDVRSRRFCALLRMAGGQRVRSFSRSILLFCVVCVVSARATDVIPPPPHDHFNDYAGIVGADAAQWLNGELAQFERDTSNQIVVAIFPRIQSDSSVGDYTVRVANA